MSNVLVRKLAETEFVRSAIAEQADLSVFRQRPTPRVIFGLCIIGFSYIIGWPAIAGLGMLSIYLQKPLIVAIGGPVLYGLSHLTFIIGTCFAGALYTRVLIRWLARVIVERFFGLVPDIVQQPATEGRCMTDRESR